MSAMSRDGYPPAVLRTPPDVQKSNDDRRVHHLTSDDKDWIMRRLRERGMSRAALGKAIGMTRQGVYAMLGDGGYTSRMDRGSTDVRLDRILRAAEEDPELAGHPVQVGDLHGGSQPARRIDREW